MSLRGVSLVGFENGAPGGERFDAIDPATGTALEPGFHSALPGDVERAAQLAAEAAEGLRQVPGGDRATLLERIAVNLESAAEVIVARVMRETALPEPRVRGELGRTCFQLRMFAELVREGSWVDARIDHGDPGRRPVPKPDVRSMLRPLGPVVVFGASNFPLAFSVAGGDTASALAAGNPVIAKAHPAHAGTSELAGRAIREAVRHSGLPPGTFSLLFDAGHEVGQALCRHPLVRAIGFTGSLRGGQALMDLAAARPEPIPVFAEMGSVNPVFVLPGAARERAEAIAQGLYASVTLGTGQFCTNPGLVIVGADEAYTALMTELAGLFADAAGGTMLTAGICAAYASGVARLEAHPAVERLGEPAGKGPAAGARPGTRAVPALFQTTGQALLRDPLLLEEVFGPSTLVVCCAAPTEMLEVARALPGQLSASIHGAPSEDGFRRELGAVLETRAGRVVHDGFPTGVEVGHAMVHGGPYPATSDGRSTSVGTRAIIRFARPLCYQDCPDAALPLELQEANPLGIRRLVDGRPG